MFGVDIIFIKTVSVCLITQLSILTKLIYSNLGVTSQKILQNRHKKKISFIKLPKLEGKMGYNAVLSCNHLYSVGARLFLPSFVATYNTALTLLVREQ